MIIKCDNCGIEFSKKPSRVSTNNYCSIKCRAEHWAKGNHPNYSRTVVKCDECGKEKIIPLNELRYKYHFCDNQCRINYFNNKVKCVCETCGNEFFRKECEINEHNFCSKACYGEYLKNGTIENCKICDKEIYVTPSKKEKGHGIYCSNKCAAIDKNVCGENHPAWKGGLRAFSEKVRAIKEYRLWRKLCFKNNKNRCDICGSEHKLQVHHIKPMRLILQDNNVTTIEDAKDCEELWDVKNGQVLCEDCHKLITFNKFNEESI